VVEEVAEAVVDAPAEVVAAVGVVVVASACAVEWAARSAKPRVPSRDPPARTTVSLRARVSARRRLDPSGGG